MATIILLTTSFTNLYAQHGSFHLDYSLSGLGSNHYVNFYPVVDINGEALAYTIEKKIGKYELSKLGTYSDTVWIKDTITYKLRMRTTSIDSIIAFVKYLKDTTIFESNPCIMSGGIHFMTIAIGHDTVKYKLMNTFDRTALKIANIINTYLPTDNKILASDQLITDCDDCWTRMRKKWEEDNKKNKN